MTIEAASLVNYKAISIEQDFALNSHFPFLEPGSFDPCKRKLQLLSYTMRSRFPIIPLI